MTASTTPAATAALTWGPHRASHGHRIIDSTCGRYTIDRTPPTRKGTPYGVVLADGGHSTTDTPFFSLFVKTPASCEQVGNYLTLNEAQAAADAHAAAQGRYL